LFDETTKASKLTLMTPILATAAILGLLAWGFLRRVRRCDLDQPRLANGARPAISVIVPARDEAQVLPALLDSLARQTLPPLEVIVADDGSSDGTAAIAAAAGARVIMPGPKPPGYRGKTWPCRRGAEEARGELLVFLDADTRLEPEGLARLAATHARQGGGLLSVEPHHETRRPYEQLSAFFNLLRVASVGGFGPLAPSPHGAYGPCVVIARDEYFASGGHARPEVRGQILEHYFLGQALLREGRRVECREGEGVIAMRMYPRGLRELVEGWSKAFVTGAGASRPSFLLLSSLWLSGAALAALTLPLAPLLFGATALLPALALYAAYALQLHGLLVKVGRFSPWTSILFPVPLLAFFVIFLRSLYLVRVRRSVSWKGQSIALEPGAERRPSC
jgi:4,4'-diaponeurosporenoate glycosyltransferase